MLITLYILLTNIWQAILSVLTGPAFYTIRGIVEGVVAELAPAIWAVYSRLRDAVLFLAGLARWGVDALGRLWRDWAGRFLRAFWFLFALCENWFVSVGGKALDAGRAIYGLALRGAAAAFLNLWQLVLGWRAVLQLLKDVGRIVGKRLDELLHVDRFVPWQALEKARAALNDLIGWTNYTWRFDGLLRVTPLLGSIEEYGSWVLPSALKGFRMSGTDARLAALAALFPFLTPAEVAARFRLQPVDYLEQLAAGVLAMRRSAGL